MHTTSLGVNAHIMVMRNDDELMRKESGEGGKNMSLDVTPEVAEDTQVILSDGDTG